MAFERSSGILLHPTSLPSKYGIGDLGEAAYKFIDFLVKSKQKLWQTLPLGPTGYGDSPYQCFSAFAGNPLLISLEKLVEEGYLSQSDIETDEKFDDNHVDYGRVINFKYALYKKAYENFKNNATLLQKTQFESFCQNEKAWLEDYTLFMACKDHFGGKVWREWEEGIATRDLGAINHYKWQLADPIGFQKFIQFLFFSQWLELKAYANRNYVKLIGDITIFVADDSADAWSNPELFQFDEKGYPIVVAGVPPDYFSATGQLWGNPLYDWEAMQKTDFNWWIDRVSSLLKVADIIRIDHFRGFEAYWAVPYGEPTAINGEWRKAPGHELFNAIKKALGDLPILAEDLGLITPGVIELRDAFGLPGMKILQFAFDSSEENNYIPHSYNPNTVVYTGTHDNDTTLGWYQKASDADKAYVNNYMHTKGDSDIVWDFIRTAWASVSNIALVPMQDLFSLDSSARMNTPGVAAGNWGWRYTEEALTDELANKLRSLTELYGR